MMIMLDFPPRTEPIVGGIGEGAVDAVENFD